MKIFRADTETRPIRPGLLAPRLICLQHATDIDGKAPVNGEVRIEIGDARRDAVMEALEDPDTLIEFFNSAFDSVVLCAAYPELVPRWFRALGNARGRDPLLREQLIAIRNGTLQDNHPKGWWSLGGIAKRRLGREIAKGDETWRLRYALLEGVPVAQWPRDAYQYAYDDVTNLRDVSRHQLKEFAPEDEWLQVAAAFCLQLAASWGVRVDGAAWDEAHTRLLHDKSESAKVLDEAGFFRDGSVNKAAVQAAVERACAKAGLKVPKTDPTDRFKDGQTKTDVDTCEMLAEHDPALTALSEHNTAGKMLSTYLEPMRFGIQYAMTSRPNALVGTGRTSWGGAKVKEYNPWWPEGTVSKKVTQSGTNMQNWPQSHGMRECIVPRPGYYFASVDYNSLELRTLGQACLWLVGHSTLARGYQEDPMWDPHTYFGGVLVGIDYQAALARKATDKTFKNGPRKVAKAANFSLPGGVGAKRLALMFEALYKAGELPKRYSIDECQGIKQDWLSAYPEMPAYFEYGAFLAETGTPLTQFVSNRVRGRVNFSAAANSFFQGLAADLAKRALFYVSQACYCEPNSPLFGSRVVAFIHDELLLEVPIPVASEASFETSRLMVLAANEVCPDVPFAAEPALMALRWSKAAEFKLDDAGRLIPFDLPL